MTMSTNITVRVRRADGHNCFILLEDSHLETPQDVIDHLIRKDAVHFGDLVTVDDVHFMVASRAATELSQAEFDEHTGAGADAPAPDEGEALCEQCLRPIPFCACDRKD